MEMLDFEDMDYEKQNQFLKQMMNFNVKDVINDDFMRAICPEFTKWDSSIWHFANWHWDTLLYGDIDLDELSAVVLLDIARLLDNDGRRTMSHTCNRFWNLLVNNKTIDRRVVVEEHCVDFTGNEIYCTRLPFSMAQWLQRDKKFMELEAFKEFIGEFSRFRTTDKVWMNWTQLDASPFSISELIETMEDYCSIFHIRSAFTCGIDTERLLNDLSAMEFVEAVVFEDALDNPGIQALSKTCQERGIEVPEYFHGYRMSKNPANGKLDVISVEELPDWCDMTEEDFGFY